MKGVSIIHDETEERTLPAVDMELISSKRGELDGSLDRSRIEVRRDGPAVPFELVEMRLMRPGGTGIRHGH